MTRISSNSRSQRHENLHSLSCAVPSGATGAGCSAPTRRRQAQRQSCPAQGVARGLLSPSLRAAFFLILVLGATAASAAAAEPHLDPRDAATITWILGFAGALGIVVGILAALNQGQQFLARLRGQTQSVSLHPDPASAYRTRGDCIAIHEKDRAWIGRVESETRAELLGERKAVKIETDNLHSRINTLHTSMNAQFCDLNKQLGSIQGGLNALLKRGDE